MGRVFERMCLQAFRRYHVAWGLAGAATWAHWEGQDRNRRSIEIDAVARLDDDRLLTGEIKWSSKPLGPEVHSGLNRDLQDLAASGHQWAREALTRERSAGHFVVSAAGFRPDIEQIIATTPNLMGWTLDDLYR
jgi:hypothetical protein